ncbi:MAG: transketolase family protein [Chloroflexi bacterium]|nr:transketolase family protein [Chloroflexota bacterium]MBI3931666.1 transketolase family protein [Chloroflexota bacterium]
MTNKKMYLIDDLYGENIKQAPTRDGYGNGLVALGEADRNVVVLCADLTDSTRSKYFADKFPDRFIEIGVAEQNMVTVASGLAAVGKIPFVASYATFCPGRCWEQIRTTICYNDRNVKIAGAHAGISVGPDGATHQALEDIALMRALPNMVVVVPCDANEAKKATIAVGKIKKPAYVRFTREKTPLFTTEKTPFQLGKAEVYRDGKDVTIIACGSLVYQALLAAKELEKDGVEATVINCHTIKPLDGKTIMKAVRQTGAVVTVEEHQITGGLGGAVAEYLSENYPVPLKRVGVQDRFGESGAPDELLKKFGLTYTDIMESVKNALRLKNER